MSQEDVEIVREVYEAVARRDTEAVLALYDPEVEWDSSKDPMGGLVGPRVYRGHEGLRDVLRAYREAWESIEDDWEKLIDAGEHVVSVVKSRGRGRASGAEVERTQYAVWTIREAKVIRVAWFTSRDEAFEAAGLRE